MNFTHKGWFGICPVYFANLDSDTPLVAPRSWWFAPLMAISELSFVTLFFLKSLLNPEFQAAWPLRVTGKFDADA